ncbi:HNH endonuclease family protein [Nocardioides sp. AX2bis]|uniref:HNH endonuclease family protein n=1 Tax=Nocardioides sp. AX2bis TaxID=2653157 RepID=UPI001F268822|nr:HNH endonuclease family protein [Nocardioides sp. AX2bis]
MSRRPSFPLSVLVLVAGLAAPLVPSAAAPGAPAPAGRQTGAAGAVYDARLGEAVGDLVVRRERREGYDRDLYTHWVDADGDGCDTRDEVLLAEAVEDPTVGDGCALSGGRWRSPYDGASWTETGDLDIDHLVPLAESWDSGARRWSDARRERFANDLGDRRALVAVTDEVNASKGDQDVREWRPDLRPCRYVRDWVAVKLRWRLSVDRREVRALRGLAGDCGDPRVRVTRAR